MESKSVSFGSLGVIPAAGDGSRWGGYYKELLPVAQGDWLLKRAVRTLKRNAETVAVISVPDKVAAHAKHLKDPNVFYVMQAEAQDIYGAMKASFPFADEQNLFMMPDTYIPEDAFDIDFYSAEFWLGTFETQTPRRFGCLLDDMIVNKMSLPAPQTAWGALVWSRDVVDMWKDVHVKSYTHAINMAMSEFEWNTFPLDYYYDMGSWDDYVEFINASRS